MVGEKEERGEGDVELRCRERFLWRAWKSALGVREGLALVPLGSRSWRFCALDCGSVLQRRTEKTITRGSIDKSAACCCRFRRRWSRAGGRQPITNLRSRRVRCGGDKSTRPVRHGHRGNPGAGRNTRVVPGQGERLRPAGVCADRPHHGTLSASSGAHPYLCPALCFPVHAVPPNTGDGAHRP
jgi:hypothetical protein